MSAAGRGAASGRIPTGLRHGTCRPPWPAAAASRSPRCAATSPPTAGTPRSSSPTISTRTRRGATSPINAMSCDGDGTLHDPVGGRADLAAGPRPLRRRRRGGGSPRTICASCASSASTPASAAARADAGGAGRLCRARGRHRRAVGRARPAGAVADPGRAPGHCGPGADAGDRRARAGRAGAAGAARARAPGRRGSGGDPLLRLAALLRPASRRRVDAVADRLQLANRERERLLALVDDATARSGGRRAAAAPSHPSARVRPLRRPYAAGRVAAG